MLKFIPEERTVAEGQGEYMIGKQVRNKKGEIEILNLFQVIKVDGVKRTILGIQSEHEDYGPGYIGLMLSNA